MRDKVLYGVDFKHKPLPKSVKREAVILPGGDCFNYFPFLKDYVNPPESIDDPKTLGLKKFMSMRTHFEGCNRCNDHYHSFQNRKLNGTK